MATRSMIARKDKNQVLEELWKKWEEQVAAVRRLVPRYVWRTIEDLAIAAYSQSDTVLLARQIDTLGYVLATAKTIIVREEG